MITQALICLQGKPPEIRTFQRGLPSKPRVILARALGVLSTRGFTCQYILASCGMATRYTVPAYVSLVDAVKALALKTGIARASIIQRLAQVLFPNACFPAGARSLGVTLHWSGADWNRVFITLFSKFPIPNPLSPATPPSQTASIQGELDD